jgi:NADH-quinone oxidoreductase subunit L
MPDFQTHPGYWFVLATVLPLASFVLLFLVGGLKFLFRRYRDAPGMEALFQLFGGDQPGPLPAYVALGAIAGAFVCSAIGFVTFLSDEHVKLNAPRHELEQTIAELEHKHQQAKGEEKKKLHEEIEEQEKLVAEIEAAWAKRRATAWKGKLFELVRVHPSGIKDPDRGTTLEVGFAIDSLAALMFVMVSFVASLIHLFSIGYMKDELDREVADHQVHTEGSHLHRRGRFGRFFMYLSLFCFSMLHLVLASNLFQVFISWELVGICSYLLIGFYYERTSASNAANKAFIVNRVGDAGFILGLLIVFAYIGTFDFEDMFRRVRSPVRDSHGHELKLAGQVVRANPGEEVKDRKGARVGQTLQVTLPGAAEPGSEVVLFPRKPPGHWHPVGAAAAEAEEGHDTPDTADAMDDPRARDYSSMPYWMLVAAGLGIFLGCVGKSAQFPLQVWLPDAMEGPTPVSALIHAATMVAAGVYLVGRVYPLFTVEVLLVIAYVGAITLFVAATIAIVMTDIKKVLAYSTVSQLGYMMLALGIGGWVAGLFHLFTHAFFKALLFLGSGSVIAGCHHEQEMTKMGGLYPKMKITALTMLVGCLAIAGTPLFSGWHSKDAVVAQCLGYVAVNPTHAVLFVLPLATAGITTFYMFRMWFLTFTGKPRDEHVHEHASESPWTMTGPLVVLALFAIVVSWGNRPWIASESHLETIIHHSMPVSVMAEFGHVREEEESGAAGQAHGETWPEAAAKPAERSERHRAHLLHDQAGVLALGISLLGFVFAYVIYYRRALDPAEAKEQFPKVYELLVNKWYFDALYSVMVVRPALMVAWACRFFDLKVIDGIIHTVARVTVRVSRVDGWIDNSIVDGLVNLVGNTTYNLGSRLRNLQTGYLRSYVLFLVLAAVAIFALLSYFVSLATAG